MKKIIKFMLLVMLCLIGSCAAGEAMSLFRKSTGEFRFEDYKTGEEAQAALLKLHPVGSDVSLLKKTLEKAGADCGEVKNPRYTYNLYCLYKQKVFFIFTYEWHISIRSNKENNIEWIKLQKGIQAL